jgi:deazaflavin-dependent oxidoreductase (nitroreductase family)
VADGPANFFFKVSGGLHVGLHRLSGGRVGGKVGKSSVLLLTTTGRKSGRKRTQPLFFSPTEDGYAVIASKGGAPQHPYWYLNLRADPRAEVTVGATTRPVRARTAEGDERELLWSALAANYSGYDKYARKTTRRIPVVVLEPDLDRRQGPASEPV